MKTYKFIKEGTGWYIDLPEYLEAGGTKGDLQMVEGADTMLELISNGAREVSLSLDKVPFPAADKLTLTEICDPAIGGGYYNLPTFEGKTFNRTMWLCGVTEYVFGDLPETIFIRREPGAARSFGLDPAGYHTARPPYPEWVYEKLIERCDLRTGTATFEIGSGTGIATRRLLELGANPLVAIEPDTRLADFLLNTLPSEPLTVIRQSFEDAILPQSAFDLGFSATAFHWLAEETALEKIAGLLKPGGWWAMVWNVFGDPNRADPFHVATTELLNGPVSPSPEEQKIPFAIDKEARIAALEKTGAFDCIEHHTSNWSLELNAAQIVNLYATYSNITILPDREAILAELGRIAREDFNDHVTRNMITSLYIAQKKR